MKKTMMYLPEDMHRYLAREASARGISMAEIAREAIAEYRVRRDESAPVGATALIGVLNDEIVATNLAEQIDETLAEQFAEGGAWEQEHGLAGPR